DRPPVVIALRRPSDTPSMRKDWTRRVGAGDVLEERQLPGRSVRRQIQGARFAGLVAQCSSNAEPETLERTGLHLLERLDKHAAGQILLVAVVEIGAAGIQRAVEDAARVAEDALEK